MNPLMLFLFCFLAISFALILVQKDLTKWQKFSLVANPALLALCVVLLLEKSRNDREYAADIAPVVNISADLLANPGSAEALKAADQESFANPLPQSFQSILYQVYTTLNFFKYCLSDRARYLSVVIVCH